MKKTILFLMLFSIGICYGQVQTYYVKPVLTDVNYSPTEDSSAISINTTSPVNKLFLFIGGTGSSSSKDYNALRLHAANLGFDFINLSYPNNVAAASLANSNDPLVFDKYRQEVCFGTSISNDVTVDSLNSIYTRTLKLIKYLDVTYPSQNWGQYLASPSSINWSKVLVGGHSQGSGHACYLAKQYLVERVLMFSGPNDYSNFFSGPANWLNQAGTTPINRHYSYLSLNDEVVAFSKQFANISGLGMLASDDTTFVDNISSPYGNSRCLYTTQPPGLVLLNHNATIKLSTINNDVWTYMLTSTIVAGLENNPKVNDIKIFPNPAKDFIFLALDNPQNQLVYSIYNVSGQLLKQNLLVQQNGGYKIDISFLKPGAYILNVNGLPKRFIKL